MKDDKKCLKFKELIMEKVDGEADAAVFDIISKHTGICPDCLKYEKTLKNMVKLTSLLKVEAPAYLETRIMASIQAKTPKFNWFPAISYGTTFVVAAFAAFFLLYNKPAVPTQDIAVVKPAAVKQEISAVKEVIRHKDIKAPVTALKTVPDAAVEKSIQPVSAEPAVEIAAGTSPGKGPVKENASVENKSAHLASVSAPETNPNYGVSSVKTDSVMSVAKVTPVATQPGLPLLDQDKAIVANNLINPNHGDAARIVIKVEETSLVKIIIYDKTGRVIAKILNEEKTPGNYDTYWYGKNDSAQTVSEGAYFVYIQIGKRVIKKHIIVNKD